MAHGRRLAWWRAQDDYTIILVNHLERPVLYNTQKMDSVRELFEIFKGEVANVTDYGAFIKIPGCTKQGLVTENTCNLLMLTVLQK